MSVKKAWIYYTLLRLVFFAVPFAIIMLLLPADQRTYLSWGVVFAALCAAAIATALSVLFLNKLRARAAEGIANWRQNAHEDAAAAEDNLIEAEATATAEDN